MDLARQAKLPRAEQVVQPVGGKLVAVDVRGHQMDLGTSIAARAIAPSADKLVEMAPPRPPHHSGPMDSPDGGPDAPPPPPGE